MDILPQTKVDELLRAFPELEEVLIAIDPTFTKLRNPLLRNSIGKIATLQQAAFVVKLSPLQLVNHLRAAIGQEQILETQE